MSTESIPIYDSKDSQRLTSLSVLFENRFGCKPDFFVRAPGRVNLIGEHIDYCGYGVCPMALMQDVVMGVSVNESSRINIFNTNNEKYPDFSTSEPLSILSEPFWYNYVLCGLIGMASNLEKKLNGLNILVDGIIPPSAGLSSSSALVCASAVVVYHVLGVGDKSASELAELCAVFERLIGTQGGGMDQAASFLSLEGSALSIDFDPLRTSSVPLPKGISFVVANSGVEINKAATKHFNVRVSECRLAAMIMAKRSGLEWRKVLKLGTLQQSLGLTLEDMLSKVEEILHMNDYTRAEVAKELDISEGVLMDEILSPNVRSVEQFSLYLRATHVYGEALRVRKFVEICQNSVQEVEDLTIQTKLGNLMNLSHHSCSVLYDCSCPMLDQLVNKCREAGALGSRLTGAGWGGCSVSIVPTKMVDQFMCRVVQEYYIENDIKSDLFVTLPSPGIRIVRWS